VHIRVRHWSLQIVRFLAIERFKVDGISGLTIDFVGGVDVRADDRHTRSCELQAQGIFEHSFFDLTENLALKSELKSPLYLPCYKKPKFACTLLALFSKSLISNGEGEGNRTLVNIPSPNSW
jgi:hypothetical protein